MTGKIYLLQPDKSLKPMEETAYDSEALLQSLLEEYPDLLAGEEMSGSEPRRWLLVSREFGVPEEEGGGGRWSVDHLFLDQDAVPTLIEVKRSSDTRIRREVVGQMLDYAANAVVYWPVEVIRTKFEAACESAGKPPEQLLADLLGEEAGDEEAIQSFWGRVKTNLQAGKVRLVFVADEIPRELQRIVEFLNTQMDPAEVFAVEVRQFVGEQQTALVPRLVGQTAAAEQKKGTVPPRQWTEESFFRELETNQGPAVSALARELLDWIRPLTDRVWWGTGGTVGSCVPVLDLEGGRRDGGTTVQFFAMWTRGQVEMYFYWLRSKPGFESDEAMRELVDRIGRIPGVELPGDAISRRPSFPLSVLSEPASMTMFKETIKWAIEKVKRAAEVDV